MLTLHAMGHRLPEKSKLRLEAVLFRSSTKKCRSIASQGVTMAATRTTSFRKTPLGCRSSLLLLMVLALAVKLPTGADGLRGCEKNACRELCREKGYDWSACRFHPHYLMNGMSICNCGHFFE